MEEYAVCTVCLSEASLPLKDTGTQGDRYGHCKKCQSWQPVTVHWRERRP